MDLNSYNMKAPTKILIKISTLSTNSPILIFTILFPNRYRLQEVSWWECQTFGCYPPSVEHEQCTCHCKTRSKNTWPGKLLIFKHIFLIISPLYGCEKKLRFHPTIWISILNSNFCKTYHDCHYRMSIYNLPQIFLPSGSFDIFFYFSLAWEFPAVESRVLCVGNQVVLGRWPTTQKDTSNKCKTLSIAFSI